MRRLLIVLCFSLAGCYQAEPTLESLRSNTAQPRATIITDVVVPTDTVISPLSATATLNPIETVTEWQSVANGIEERVTIPPANALAQMVTLRLDPTKVSFRVHYSPNAPLTVQEWRQQLPTALVIINANFFTPEHTILGMLMSDGVLHGQSYTDRGGTFFVQNGVPSIRSNVAEPYLGEAWEQAVQAFPMLVVGSASAYSNTRDTRPSRRTIIGQDTSGRIIIMSTPGIGLGLYDLSAYLPTTDLDLWNAFNLDGGGSTMMVIAPSNYVITSFDPVPAVLAVYAQ